MSNSATEAFLFRVCARCGEYYAAHRASDSACPIRELEQPQRITGYQKDRHFMEWFDEFDENSSEGMP